MGPDPAIDLQGTYRVRSAGETWELVEPHIHAHGITRVADITRLDNIGVPVWMALRPMAATVSCSLGKGATPDLARLSAVMEAIEVETAERFCHVDLRAKPASSLELPYDVCSLASLERLLLSEQTPLDWVLAEDLSTGAAVPVPDWSVSLDGRADHRWSPRVGFRSTNGLASGNTENEATFHALLEIVERHALAGLGVIALRDRRIVSLGEVPGTENQALVNRLRNEGFWIEIVDASNLAGTWCFLIYLWREDVPALIGGSGAHIIASVALSRALTEAVQSRAGVISGVRDDVSVEVFRYERGHPEESAPGRSPGSGKYHDGPAPSWISLDTELRRLVDAVTSVTSAPVLRVPLGSGEYPFSVCKVVAPGMEFDVYRQVDRVDGTAA